MNIALWIIQILVAVAFALAGFMKVSRPYAQLNARMSWTKNFSPAAVRAIGALELLGAIGLILPPLTHILPWLAVVAAGGLTLTMIGAMVEHARHGDFGRIQPSVVLFVLALFLFVGRLAWAPLA
jgi:uncharacterized membrane protein YphA (DoxX/SURF4 family)